MKDKIYTLHIAPGCEPPVRDMDTEWVATDNAILKLAALGELLDAQGKAVPACVSCEGVTTYYTFDLFGELVEVQP